MGTVLPSARSLYLCESYRTYAVAQERRVDLSGIFNSLRVSQSFPYALPRFCAFAQLVNGLGHVPFFIDIRRADDELVIWTTSRQELFFPTRTKIVQMAITIEGCRFELPGVYFIELYCDNTWIADTRLVLHERTT